MDFVMIKTEEDAKALWSTEARTRHQNPINSGGDWKGDKKICPGESVKNAPAAKNWATEEKRKVMPCWPKGHYPIPSSTTIHRI
jgi:hypothetical protein